MQRLFNYLLVDEITYGVATESEIAAISKEKNALVWVQIVASYENVQDFVCEGGTVDEGFYIVDDGVIEVCGENEDYEIVLISNLRIA